MPIVTIHLMKGRDNGKKRLLVEKVTEDSGTSIGVQPKNVRIILSEMAPNDYAIAGQLVMDQADPFGEKK